MLDQLLAQFTEDMLPGCALVVSRHGEVIYEGYYGWANLERRKPIAPDTVYRIFSMTKVVVCTAALMLYERGKFLLHDPLAEYIPEYGRPLVARTKPDGSVELEPAQNPILIQHLFCMSSGLPYHFGESESERQMRRVLDELEQTHGVYDIQTEVKAMAAVPLAFEPGTSWMYGYSHDVLGALIEVVSGKTLGRFLQEEIFEPLGMKDTGYRFRGDIADRMASVYQRTEDGRLEEVPGALDQHHQPGAKRESGGVGLYSTARDYTAFTQMLASGGRLNGETIIGRKTIELMRRNHLSDEQMRAYTHANGHRNGYGYGLGVRTLIDPAEGGINGSIGEFGWGGAAGTWMAADPVEDMSIVYMQQMFPSIHDRYVHPRVRNAVNACMG